MLCLSGMYGQVTAGYHAAEVPHLCRFWLIASGYVTSCNCLLLMIVRAPRAEQRLCDLHQTNQLSAKQKIRKPDRPHENTPGDHTIQCAMWWRSALCERPGGARQLSSSRSLLCRLYRWQSVNWAIGSCHRPKLHFDAQVQCTRSSE